MNRKKLEEKTYKALEQYFGSYQDGEVADGKLYCQIPPGILSYVLESLVTPVVTAILADYLIRKRQSAREKKNVTEVEELKGKAIRTTGKWIRKLGIGPNKAEEVCDKVSATVTVEFEAASEDELEEVLGDVMGLLIKFSDQ